VEGVVVVVGSVVGIVFNVVNSALSAAFDRVRHCIIAEQRNESSFSRRQYKLCIGLIYDGLTVTVWFLLTTV